MCLLKKAIRLKIKNHKKAVVFYIIYCLGFLFATFTHLLDLIHGSYKDIPVFFAFFWSSLTVIDFFVFLLLIFNVILGLILSIFVITADVIINTVYALMYGYSLINLSLIMQYVAFIFVAVTIPFMLKFFNRIKTNNATEY